MGEFLSRHERFDVVGSTNDVVRGWLDDGVAEVAVALADEQTAGRGRGGRQWQAPRGAALLVSLGFRPAWLPAERVWWLAAAASLAMADAGEAVADLGAGTIRLKWPNDLVIETAVDVRKLAGVLGESDGLGTADPRVIIGLGINADWSASAFPIELAPTMTSLREAAGDAPVDRGALATVFLERLRPRIEALRAGRFDAEEWSARQVTTGRSIRVEWRDGSFGDVRASGVDADSGALLVEDPERPDIDRAVMVGEVLRVRLATSPTVGV